MEKIRKQSQAEVSALNCSPTSTLACPLIQIHSPELEVSSCTKVRGQLLDEGKEHRLGEWARWLPKNLPWVHSFTHIQHQVQVGSRQGLE